MRIFIIIVMLYNVLPALSHIELFNEDLGDLHFHAEAGELPLKYFPLTERDRVASDKAADVIDFIHLVPNVDPLHSDLLPPLGIDVPFLWLRGKVYMKNFVIAGIKQLLVNSVEVRLDNLRTDLNIRVPLVYVEGDFYFQASISFFDLMFNCHISANLMDVDVSVSSASKIVDYPPTGDIMQIDGAAIDVDIRNIQFNLTDLEIGGEENDVGVVVRQLFSGNTDGNVFDNLLIAALDMANDQLLTVPAELFKSYLIDNL